MISSRRERRRRRALAEPFPATWRHSIARRWAIWPTLAPDEQRRLEELVQQFVPEMRWEAAQGFAVTEEMQAVIAAQACLLVLEMESPSRTTCSPSTA
ncbi:MAG: zinc-dependent peptidase [Actinobacteria bacterium]|nr:zinc-dependent peptidase [Actinomycetota bacterium]